VQTDVINVTLDYKYTPRTEVAYINCFINNLNTFANKTPVPNSGALFAYPFIDKKLYYNSGLSLNKSIDLTSISL